MKKFLLASSLAFSLFCVPMMAQTDILSRYLMEERYPELITYSDSLLTSDTTNFKLFYLRGMAFKGMQDFLQAEKSFHKAWENGHLLQSGIQLGQLYQETGQSDKAKCIYTSILESDSSNARVRYSLGKLQLADGNTAGAISHFSFLYASDTTNPVYLRSLADAYDQAGDIPAAISFYLKAVDLNPADRNSTFRLSNLFIKINAVPTGIKYAGNFLETHPEDVKFLKLYGYLNLLILQPREAISSFQKAVSLGDSSFFTHKYMGIACHDISNYDTSIFYLKEARRAEPKDAELTFYIGKCYSMLSVPDSAIPYLLNTISLLNPSPSFIASIQMTIAENYNLKKRPDDALMCIYEARRLNEDPEVFFMLARQYDFFSNQKDSAEFYYKRFVDLVSTGEKGSTDRELHEHLSRARERLNKFKEDRFWNGQTDTAQVK